mmetsp:Transcript_31367/g.88385  ORF Transcript_31367/g.88385 Transcript_31367/m.88385 type:complete len:247 (-) Transcript_31367:5-745(-)
MERRTNSDSLRARDPILLSFPSTSHPGGLWTTASDPRRCTTRGSWPAASASGGSSSPGASLGSASGTDASSMLPCSTIASRILARNCSSHSRLPSTCAASEHDQATLARSPPVGLRAASSRSALGSDKRAFAASKNAAWCSPPAARAQTPLASSCGRMGQTAPRRICATARSASSRRRRGRFSVVRAHITLAIACPRSRPIGALSMYASEPAAIRSVAIAHSVFETSWLFALPIPSAAAPRRACSV